MGGAESNKSCGISTYGRVRVIIIDKMLTGKYGSNVICNAAFLHELKICYVIVNQLSVNNDIYMEHSVTHEKTYMKGKATASDIKMLLYMY